MNQCYEPTRPRWCAHGECHPLHVAVSETWGCAGWFAQALDPDVPDPRNHRLCARQDGHLTELLLTGIEARTLAYLSKAIQEDD